MIKMQSRKVPQLKITIIITQACHLSSITFENTTHTNLKISIITNWLDWNSIKLITFRRTSLQFFTMDILRGHDMYHHYMHNNREKIDIQTISFD